MQVGFAQVDITPPVGALIPGGFRKNVSTGVHDPLHATAIVLDDGVTAVALVSVDCLSLKASTVKTAREIVHRESGIPPSHVLIAATHTHSGGPVADVFESEADEGYCTWLAQQIGTAVARAYERRVPSQIGIGVGHESRVAFNRRFVMRNGLHQTHPGKGNPNIVKPAGPVDPDVGVMAARDEKGQLLGCVVNFACHCTVMGGSKFSADYPFYLAQTVREVFGGQCFVVFLPGACGDVTQVASTIPRENEFGEKWAWKIGTTLGGEVVKTVALMDFTDAAPLQAAQSQIRLAVRQVPAEMLDAAKRLLMTDGDWSVERVYARELVLLDEQSRREPFVNAEVQVIGIGRSAFVAIPGELFCRFGRDIKRESPFPTTFVVASCANGMVGYIPTPDAFKGGGYEVRLARSSKLMPEAGEHLVAEALKLMRQLTVPEPQNSPPVTTPAWDVGASPPELTGLKI